MEVKKSWTLILMQLSEQYLESVSVFKETLCFFLSLKRQPKNLEIIAHVQKVPIWLRRHSKQKFISWPTPSQQNLSRDPVPLSQVFTFTPSDKCCVAGFQDCTTLMIPKPLRKTVPTDTTSVQSVRLTQYWTVTDVYGSLTLLLLTVVKSQLVGAGEGTVKI